MSPSLKGRNAKLKCSIKRKYTTQSEAWGVANRMRGQGYLGARPYRCNGARGEQAHWHVTTGRKW